jgi:hypothetical protein
VATASGNKELPEQACKTLGTQSSRVQLADPTLIKLLEGTVNPVSKHALCLKSDFHFPDTTRVDRRASTACRYFNVNSNLSAHNEV